MAVDISSYQHWRFTLGDNIKCIVSATEVFFGVYDKFKIQSISGSGDMYADSSMFTSEYYNPDTQAWVAADVTWSLFLAGTLNFFSQPRIAQGAISIPSGVTSVASNFMNGFVFSSVSLPEGLVSIGDYAFAGGYTNINRTALSGGTANQITSLVIPSTVEHIGKAAFQDANFLESITFNNNEYILEDYTSTGYGAGIFYVGIGNGSNLDDDGYFITNVTGGNGVTAFDWKNKYNRIIQQTVAGYIYVYSESASKIIKLPVWSEQGEIGVYFSSIDDVRWLKLVPVNNVKASPVRVKTANNGIMAISY